MKLIRGKRVPSRTSASFRFRRSDSSGSPVKLTLESAVEFINYDELEQLKTICLRKRYPADFERKRCVAVPKAKNLPGYKKRGVLQRRSRPAARLTLRRLSCGVYLSGGSQALGAPTPEALMRSRHSAYVPAVTMFMCSPPGVRKRSPQGSLSQGKPAEVDESLKCWHSTAADGQKRRSALSRCSTGERAAHLKMEEHLHFRR